MIRPTPKLRAAVVGVGHLGRHHARNLAAHPDVDLVAVADPRPTQAEAVAQLHGTRAVTDYRALLGAVDLVSIAAPTSLHRAIAGEFLEHGVHTLVEKPLTARVDEAEELVDLAAERSLTLQVGHIERFNPVLQALDKFPITPRYIAADRLGTYTFRSTDIGVVHDLMIHDIDLVLALITARPRQVAAVGLPVFGGLEDVAEARIEFDDGAVATIRASRSSYKPARTMRIWGPEGYLSLDFAAKRAVFVKPSQALRSGAIAPPSAETLANAELLRSHVFGAMLESETFEAEGPEPLALEIDEFVQAVRGGPAPRVDGETALRALQVAERVAVAIRTQGWAEPADQVPPPPHVGHTRPARTRADVAHRADD